MVDMLINNLYLKVSFFMYYNTAERTEHQISHLLFFFFFLILPHEMDLGQYFPRQPLC